jgi:hypothetical protein
MTAQPLDPLEAAIRAAAARALRRRADAIRKRAAVGVTVLDRSPPVLVVTSESATALRIARDFSDLAGDLEAT